MTDQWSQPTTGTWDPASETPYVHWWLERENPNPAGSSSDDPERFCTPKLSIPTRDGALAFLSMPVPVASANPSVLQAAGPTLPDWKTNDVKDAFSRAAIGKMGKKTVLVGVIDMGIPLSHHRTTLSTGKTRVLASWQQTASFGGQASLPFGQELYAPDIDALRTAHTVQGQLDEDGFNRAARLVEPQRRYGHRDLDRRASHGAHVLDLAAGYAPEAAEAKDLRLLCVNLPPQALHGSAGNFITHFAGFAVERIVFLADALWDIQNPDKAGKGGYPLVINFSFGRQAGQKDGGALWERRMQALTDARRTGPRKAPTQIVMPVGNQNLSRGNATKPLGKVTEGLHPQMALPWFVPPMDQTANFVEFWSATQQDQSGTLPEAAPADFQWQIDPPRQTVGPVPALAPGQYTDLGDYARVYCYQAPGEDRPNFVIAVAPTHEQRPGRPEAPAGHWSLRVTYAGDPKQNALMGVQTDQAGTVDSRIAGQSYFDHPHYHTHNAAGRAFDSFDEARDAEPWAQNGPVQRKGSHNALATWDGVFVIGSYRITDTAPLNFASTFGDPPQQAGGRKAPSVLLPGQDSPAMFGLLGAGSRDGSLVTFRGTSMSTALATRVIGEEMRRTGAAVTEAWLQAQAMANAPPSDPRKSGAGPVPMPDVGRKAARLGEV